MTGPPDLLTVRVDLGRAGNEEAGGSSGGQRAVGSHVVQHALERNGPLRGDEGVDADIARPVEGLYRGGEQAGQAEPSRISNPHDRGVPMGELRTRSEGMSR